MKRMVLVLALLALPAVCVAEIYQWVDDKGQIGFADDLGNVPAKYRKRATPLKGEEPAVEVIDKTEAEKAPRKGGDVRSGQAAAGEEKPKAKAKEKPLFDGKDGETWRREFTRLKSELKSLEDQTADYKARVANPGKVSRGEYLSLQNTLRDLEFRSTATQKKLDALSDAADRAEVPAEFR